MSEVAGTPHGLPLPSRTVGAPAPAADDLVHEAYSFACMRCGHGWEEEFEIEHHVDGEGHPFVTYFAHGQRVPSPLTRPNCLNCGGQILRIMRSGRVSSAQGGLHAGVPAAGPLVMPRGENPVKAAKAGSTAAPGSGEPRHHWHLHLADLLHFFQRRH